MFQLHLNDSALDLDQASTTTLVLACPIFDRNRVGRVFTMPFRLPLSPANRAVLGHRNRLDARAKGEVFADATLFLGGAEWQRGELVVTNSDLDSIEVVFRNKPVTLWDDAKNIKLRDLLDTVGPGGTGVGGTYQFQMSPSLPNTWSFDFGSVGATYTSAPGETLAQATLQFGSVIGAAVPGILAGASSGLITLNSSVVNKAAIEGTVSLTFLGAQIESDDDFENLSTFIEANLTADSPDVVFPLIRWFGFYAEKNNGDFGQLSQPFWSNIINPIFNGTLEKNDPADEPIFSFSVIPMARLRHVFEKVRVALGIGALEGLAKNVDFERLIFTSNYALDWMLEEWIPDPETGFTTVKKWNNGYRQSINLNHHIPDWTAEELFEKIGQIFQLWYDLDGTQLNFRPLREMIEKPALDWSAFIEPEMRQRIGQEKGKKLALLVNKKELFTPQPPDKIIADGKERIDLGIGTMAMSEYIGWTPSQFRFPHTRQKGATEAYGFGRGDDYPPQLLFYRGEQVGMLGSDTYEYATNDDKAPNGTTVIGEMSLLWDGDNGLYEKFWKGIVELDGATEISFEAWLPVAELFSLRKWDNARVRFWHPEGEAVVVLKEIQAAISASDDSGVVKCRISALLEP
jgi:hypothetical protein